MAYAQTADIRRQVAQILRPPRRMPVSQAAAQYVRIGGGAGTSKTWDPQQTPYMIEPMDCISSRQHNVIVFVGPARTGKTEALADCVVGYIVKCDPGDTTIYQPTQDQARDYSRRRIDRLFRHSPDLKTEIASGTHSDNTFDKQMRNGMILSIGWPTISQLSSKDIRYVILPDYDRGAENIGGEGDKFSLAKKRTETFMSAGKTIVESSPGYEWINSKWTPQTPHELPPASGIVTLYNRGDRRRYYWPCLECNEWFIPTFELLVWRELSDPARAAETAQIGCPHCGSLFANKHKREFNLAGKWLKEGQSITGDGEIIGDGRRSQYATFHVTGPQAAFNSFGNLVYSYIVALREFESSGDDTALRATITGDQGVPYKPHNNRDSRNAKDIQDRAEVWPKLTVPAGVRFLVAAVDIQKNRFVVQVAGYGPQKERWLIDRYNLAKSKRDENHVDPGAYGEDWDLLIPLIGKKYELADGSGRWMAIQHVGCDSGGAEGVTVKAYDFWRKLRHDPDLKKLNLFKRFHLIKGRPTGNERTKVDYPDTSRRKARGASRGDVPVMMVNVNIIKDALDNDLRRKDAGAGYYHTPDWIGGWWYDELTKEDRGDKGWMPKSGNESWDLAVYAEALAIHIGIEKINWATPPVWAAEWDSNRFVFDSEGRELPLQPQPVNRPTAQRSGWNVDASWLR